MALTGNKSTLTRDGRQFEYGVAANAAIFQGALVQFNGDNVEKAAGAAGKKYGGIAQDQATGSATAGDVKVSCRRRVAAFFKHAAVAGRVTQLGIGDTAYVEDDETVTSIDDVDTANTVDRSALGEVLAVESGGVWVWVG